MMSYITSWDTILQGLFSQWVSSLAIPDPSSATVILKTLDPKAFYLTFNYTNTLTELYGVEPCCISTEVRKRGMNSS